MKIVYINKETGEEVEYGENITIIEKGTYSNGYTYEIASTLPIINETIPMLIEQGNIIQKVIDDTKKEGNIKHSKEKCETNVYKKIDILTKNIKDINERLDAFEDAFMKYFLH